MAYKIVTIADTHGGFRFFYEEEPETLRMAFNGANAVILLGDLTREDVEYLFEICANIPVYGIQGNHDDPNVYDGFPVIDISLTTMPLQNTGLKLTGIYGCVRYKEPAYQPFSMTQKESVDLAKKLDKVHILISHDGPYNCCKHTSNRHKGLKGVTYYIKKNKPATVLFGHHHCNVSFQEGQTTCHGTYLLNSFVIDETTGKVLDRWEYDPMEEKE